jgi:CheY-like chemotaxis protein
MPGQDLILIVEDNPDDRMILGRALQRAGVETPVQMVHDGEQAIQYLTGAGQYADRAEFPMPTLLLLDLKMPKVDGFEVLRWVRQQPAGLRELPIVVLTTSNYGKDVLEAYAAGANAFLVKPNDLEICVRQIKSLDAFWLRQCTLPAVSEAA